MKSSRRKFKVTVGLAVVIILFLTGVTYGGWSETLSIRGIFTTANFIVEFGDEKDIEVRLVTLDDHNNITVKEEVKDIVVTKNGNKNISLSLKDELINKLKTDGYFLQVKYPLRTSDDSKIKAIKPIEANFTEPDEIIMVIPDSVKITLDDKKIDINEEVNKSDYKISFNVYKQIEVNADKNSAIVFMEIDKQSEHKEIFSVDYLELTNNFTQYTDISHDTPVIDVRLEANYSLEIPIAAEQFNIGEIKIGD